MDGKHYENKCMKRKYLELNEAKEMGSWKEREWSTYENLRYSYFFPYSGDFGS